MMSLAKLSRLNQKRRIQRKVKQQLLDISRRVCASPVSAQREENEALSPVQSLLKPLPPVCPASQSAFPAVQSNVGSSQEPQVTAYFREALIQVLTCVEQLKSQISDLNRKVDMLLLQNSSLLSDDEDEEDVQAGLPLQTFEDVEVLEQKLQDETYNKLLCRRLSLIGGADLRNTVWRLLQAVMTNALACHYNWAGRGGVKRAFSGLALRALICRAARVNFSNATDDQIGNLIKNWLRLARDRDGGRRKRSISAVQYNSTLQL
ncbi:uncharacterized protein LOC118807481 isoform X2 [Colossoma macropomum]|nr:uncharacterized protein LOC118807481 isoform X2 [Colossoma macropomum]